jgi:hypothetical protein
MEEHMHSSFVQKLVDHEIRHVVAVKVKRGGLLRASAVVDAIKRTYPKTAGLSDREIEDMVIAAASKAGLPVEMGRGA